MKIGAAYFASLSSSSLAGRDRTIAAVCYDSREVVKNAMYAALIGERADGYSFIPEAIRKGASVILIDRHHTDIIAKYASSDVSFIIASDVARALARFASLHVLNNKKFTGICVTGSCGKTTTKEMLSSILSVSHSVGKTPGNLNSTLGLPLALLTLDETAEYAVFEMGVDHVGEMDMLTSVFPPEIALITNIGLSHLEKFKSREAIAREKGRIFLPQTAGFVPDDEEFLQYFRTVSDNVSAVSNPFTDIEFLGLEGIRLSLGKERFVMPTVGLHNIKDAALACAAARSLGIPDREIARGLSSMKALFGRSRVVREGSLTVIEDCYNASLDSVSDAIATLSNVRWNRNKHIVLGDMKELGSASRSAHRTVGRMLCSADCQYIYLYGSEMEEAYKVLYDNGQKERAVYTPDFEVLSSSIRKETSHGDLFLLKGSRSMAMERLFDTFKEVG